MKTEKELKRLFIKALDSEDGHYFDKGECWYCGFNDGIKMTLLYILGEGEIYQTVEGGSKRIASRSKKDYIEYYSKFKNETSSIYE